MSIKSRIAAAAAALAIAASLTIPTSEAQARGGWGIAAGLIGGAVAASSSTNSEAYSITSSARASSVAGTVSPSAFAVFRLMTSSNLVGCSIGRSAGLAPFRILLI